MKSIAWSSVQQSWVQQGRVETWIISHQQTNKAESYMLNKAEIPLLLGRALLSVYACKDIQKICAIALEKKKKLGVTLLSHSHLLSLGLWDCMVLYNHPPKKRLFKLAVVTAEPILVSAWTQKLQERPQDGSNSSVLLWHSQGFLAGMAHLRGLSLFTQGLLS